MTSLDRADDIVKQNKWPDGLGKALADARAACNPDGSKMSQKELATKTSFGVKLIQDIEDGKSQVMTVTPAELQTFIKRAERVLNHHLRGSQMGKPRLLKRQQEELAKKEAAEKKAAKEAAKEAARVKKEKEAAEAEAEAEAQAKKEAEEAQEKEETEKENGQENAASDADATAAALAKAQLDDEEDDDAEE